VPNAYVLISCDLGSEKALIDELKTIQGVIEVMGTFGIYDIIAKIKAEDDHKLREIITWKIRKMNNIKSTLTLLEIKDQC
jgi:DNA-binding Lrp family transcriptional regulator